MTCFFGASGLGGRLDCCDRLPGRTRRGRLLLGRAAEQAGHAESDDQFFMRLS